MIVAQQIYNLYFSPQKKIIHSLSNIIGFVPANYSCYDLALRHSSVSKEVGENNERLEFLGDAVLSSVIAEYLFKRYPLRSEGFLTEMRSKMVSRNQLGQVAKKIGLETFLQYNLSDKYSSRETILGDALESLIGAIYMDRGYEKVKKFVLEKIVRPFLDVAELEQTEYNYKSKLLEWAQSRNQKIDYTVLEEIDLRHRKVYKIGANINGELTGEGSGFSKKEAEQKAAQDAFQKISNS